MGLCVQPARFCAVDTAIPRLADKESRKHSQVVRAEWAATNIVLTSVDRE